VPDGHAIEEAENPALVSEIDPERDAARRFWAEFLVGLKLDDPEQLTPGSGTSRLPRLHASGSKRH
jgi:hypothetical protein